MKMPFKSLMIFALFALALSAHADEIFRTLQANGNIYTNVTVTAITATDIYFSYDGGMGNAKIKNLSPELQKHFAYNATRAAAREKQQALANAQYQVHVSQAPAGKPADESRNPEQASTAGSSAAWGTDLPAALNQARSENKLVLMDFTGSDWCPWCIKFDQEALSTSRFADYAASKLVLVRLDFPHNLPQSEELRRANRELYDRFNVHGYPTYILTDASGRELGRQVGYAPGGPDAFLAKLDGFSRK